MPLRLLAHGGTTFAERARIGRWPEIHPDVLQDTYGVGPNLRSYGFGLLGGDPFLILRERQQSGERFYPYTLLLDPGEAAWKRFGWNAAALAHSIFQADQSSNEMVGWRIWKDPARVKEDQLAEWLGKLDTKSIAMPGNQTGHATLEASEKIKHLWVAAFLEKTSLVVVPSQIGMAERPEAGALAEILQALPVDFRWGRGWLIGGATPHGAAYGSQLVLDDVRKDGVAEIEQRIEQGRIIWKAWERAKDSKLGPYMKPLLYKQMPDGDFVGSEIEQLLAVAQVLDSKAGAGEFFRFLSEKNASSPFSDLIWEEACARCNDGLTALSASETRSAVNHAFIRKIEVPQAVQRRMDNEALLLSLRELGYPREKLAFLKLPLALEFQYWMAEMRMPNCKPVNAYEDAIIGGRWSTVELSKLLNEALTQSENTQEPLDEWVNHEHQPVVSGWQQAQADKRLKARSPGSWATDFLRYGNLKNVKKATFLGDINAVESLIDKALANTELPKSIAWLNFLSEDHAKDLPIEIKRRVGKCMVQADPASPWAAFFALDELISGRFHQPVEANEDTLKWLQSELEKWLDAFSKSNFASNPPNIVGLIAWEELLTQPIVKTIIGLTPMFINLNPKSDELRDALFKMEEQAGLLSGQEGQGRQPYQWIQNMLFSENSSSNELLMDHFCHVQTSLRRDFQKYKILRDRIIMAVKGGLDAGSYKVFVMRNQEEDFRELLFKIIFEDQETRVRAAGAYLSGNVLRFEKVVDSAKSRDIVSCFERAALEYFSCNQKDARTLRWDYDTADCDEDREQRGRPEIHDLLNKRFVQGLSSDEEGKIDV